MDRLIAAAKAEFSEAGYAATTAAIARRAEITEAQLFRYFPSKADLFRETVFKPMEEHIRRFTDDALPAGDDDEAMRDRARLYIHELQAFLMEHARMLRSLLATHAYAGDAQPTAGINSIARYFDRGAAMFAESMGRNSPVDPRLMVRVSFAALLACALLDDWLFPPELASREARDAAIQTFIVNGITPGGPR